MNPKTLKALRAYEETLSDVHDPDNDEIIDLLSDLTRILVADVEARRIQDDGVVEDEA